MNLASLKLKNYGKFKDFECTLTPGLNVIKGGNETGKSTLVRAITQLLYQNPESGAKDIVIKTRTWGSDGPLVLKADIQSNDFSGTIEKDFDSGQAKMDNSKLNITIDDNERISEILTNATGFNSIELFEATSCIRQGEISRIEGSIQAIKDKLESLVTGGKEEQAASQIIDRINQRIDNISRKDDDNPGLMQNLGQIQNDIDYNIDKISRDIKNYKNWRNSLIQVEVAYINGKEDYEDKKQKLDIAIKAQKAQQELEKLNKEQKDTVKNFEKVKEASKKINELTSQLTNAVKIPRADIGQIKELESSLKYLQPKKHDLESDVESEQEAYDSHKVGAGGIGLMFVSLGGVGFAVADYFMKFTEFVYEMGGGAAALLLISLLIISRAVAKKAFLKEQLKSKTKKLDGVKEEIDDLSAKLKDLLDKNKVSCTEEAQQITWKRNELEIQIKEEKKIYAQNLGGISEQEMEARIQNIEKEILDYRSNLDNHEMVDEAEIERLKLIVAQLEEQKSNIEKEYQSLIRQIETAEGGAELLASYQERKEALGLQMAELVEELSVLNLTKECIEKARQDVMFSTLELLEKRTSEILDLITGSKYGRVRFDKASLKFEVFSNEKNDWVEPHQELSQATIEQIYLTARLALTEILGDNAKPPIILDDTFDHFDPQRHEGTMVLLKRMAKDRQILLLTSDDDYDKWADNTVQL